MLFCVPASAAGEGGCHEYAKHVLYSVLSYATLSALQLLLGHPVSLRVLQVKGAAMNKPHTFFILY